MASSRNQITIDETAVEREYLAAALRRSQFLAKNDAEKANREFDKLYKLLKEGLRPLPDKGEAALKRIAENPNPDVQIEAAAALLTIDEPYATHLLETVVNRRGPGSFTAEMTLQEWKKGKLRDYLS